MNVLRFVGKLLSAVWECIILGLFIGAFYGLIEGAFFGALCGFAVSLSGKMAMFGNNGMVSNGVAFGAIFGVMQGAGCGLLSGIVIGARHWAWRGEFTPLYGALRIGARAAFLGGCAGALSGILAMNTIWKSGSSNPGDALFAGFLPGSVIGWCSCFLIGALWAGLAKQRPRAVAPPLEAVLRWLWGEKRGAKLREL